MRYLKDNFRCAKIIDSIFSGVNPRKIVYISDLFGKKQRILIKD